MTVAVMQKIVIYLVFYFIPHACFGELQLHINNNMFDEYVHKGVR